VPNKQHESLSPTMSTTTTTTDSASATPPKPNFPTMEPPQAPLGAAPPAAVSTSTTTTTLLTTSTQSINDGEVCHPPNCFLPQNIDKCNGHPDGITQADCAADLVCITISVTDGDLTESRCRPAQPSVTMATTTTASLRERGFGNDYGFDNDDAANAPIDGGDGYDGAPDRDDGLNGGTLAPSTDDDDASYYVKVLPWDCQPPPLSGESGMPPKQLADECKSAWPSEWFMTSSKITALCRSHSCNGDSATGKAPGCLIMDSDNGQPSLEASVNRCGDKEWLDDLPYKDISSLPTDVDIVGTVHPDDGTPSDPLGRCALLHGLNTDTDDDKQFVWCGAKDPRPGTSTDAEDDTGYGAPLFGYDDDAVKYMKNVSTATTPRIVPATQPGVTVTTPPLITAFAPGTPKDVVLCTEYDGEAACVTDHPGCSWDSDSRTCKVGHPPDTKCSDILDAPAVNGGEWGANCNKSPLGCEYSLKTLLCDDRSSPPITPTSETRTSTVTTATTVATTTAMTPVRATRSVTRSTATTTPTTTIDAAEAAAEAAEQAAEAAAAADEVTKKMDCILQGCMWALGNGPNNQPRGMCNCVATTQEAKKRNPDTAPSRATAAPTTVSSTVDPVAHVHTVEATTTAGSTTTGDWFRGTTQQHTRSKDASTTSRPGLDGGEDGVDGEDAHAHAQSKAWGQEKQITVASICAAVLLFLASFLVATKHGKLKSKRKRSGEAGQYGILENTHSDSTSIVGGFNASGSQFVADLFPLMSMHADSMHADSMHADLASGGGAGAGAGGGGGAGGGRGGGVAADAKSDVSSIHLLGSEDVFLTLAQLDDGMRQQQQQQQQQQHLHLQQQQQQLQQQQQQLQQETLSLHHVKHDPDVRSSVPMVMPPQQQHEAPLHHHIKREPFRVAEYSFGSGPHYPLHTTPQAHAASRAQMPSWGAANGGIPRSQPAVQQAYMSAANLNLAAAATAFGGGGAGAMHHAAPITAMPTLSYPTNLNAVQQLQMQHLHQQQQQYHFQNTGRHLRPYINQYHADYEADGGSSEADSLGAPPQKKKKSINSIHSHTILSTNTSSESSGSPAYHGSSTSSGSASPQHEHVEAEVDAFTYHMDPASPEEYVPTPTVAPMPALIGANSMSNSFTQASSSSIRSVHSSGGGSSSSNTIIPDPTSWLNNVGSTLSAMPATTAAGLLGDDDDGAGAGAMSIARSLQIATPLQIATHQESMHAGRAMHAGRTPSPTTPSITIPKLPSTATKSKAAVKTPRTAQSTATTAAAAFAADGDGDGDDGAAASSRGRAKRAPRATALAAAAAKDAADRAEAKTKLREERSKTVVAEGRASPEGAPCPADIIIPGQGVVRKNGTFATWVLELGTKERNALYKSSPLSFEEKKELVKRSRQHKQAIAHKRYRTKQKEKDDDMKVMAEKKAAARKAKSGK